MTAAASAGRSGFSQASSAAPASPRTHRHGTRYAYIRHGCRCQPCTQANTDAAREYRRRRNPDGDTRRLGHGTRACYARGCRRDECREAHRRYIAGLRDLHRQLAGDPAPFVDPVVVLARLLWLFDQGATQKWVSERTGIPKVTLWRLRERPPENVRRSTAERIEALARAVGSGDAIPPGYAQAQARKRQRERMRDYRGRAA
jgi:hypothetical protein